MQNIIIEKNGQRYGYDLDDETQAPYMLKMLDTRPDRIDDIAPNRALELLEQDGWVNVTQQVAQEQQAAQQAAQAAQQAATLQNQKTEGYSRAAYYNSVLGSGIPLQNESAIRAALAQAQGVAIQAGVLDDLVTPVPAQGGN